MNEWKKDEFGRRYRMIGNIKEYEMMIRVDGGIEIPESQLAAYNASKTQKPPQEVKKTLGRCPFKSGHDTGCRSDCALYTDRGCKIVNKALKTETAGKYCPFSLYLCTSDCRLYDSGCTI